MSTFRGYNNNPNLPKPTYKHAFTQKELDEYMKCADDPVYFAKTYVKIVTMDQGLVNFPIWDFQEDMIRTFHENRFTICKLPRQVGKTTTSVAFLLHYILFNEYVRVAILANKGAIAREIMSRLQLAFEYLPNFLKQGVVEWNKGSIELANGSTVVADSTSGSSVRGKSFNIIFLDEFAHVPNGVATTFFNSTFPTISSGKETKVIIVSTPLGLNLFYRLWMDAIDKKNFYVPITVHWSDVPGRDEAWKDTMIRNTSEEQFRQEFECEFVGSTNTLIHSNKLLALRSASLVTHEDGLDVYALPEVGHTYAITVDVSEGLGKDYSAFSVFDVTQIPYVQVAKYRRSDISPVLYPTVIYKVAQKYNEAFVLVEINSIGMQVANILHYDLAYDNLLKIQNSGKSGQEITSGFTNKIQYGLKTTAQSKRIGCANLKTLIENDKLIVQDPDTIMELTTFSEHRNSFSAEEGNNDDLAMTLVHFGWLTAQKMFKQSINSDIRKVLQEEQMHIMDTDLVPFGAIDNGLDDPWNAPMRDEKEVWVEERAKLYPFDDFNWDRRF